MSGTVQTKITCISEISAIYYALLQSGYEYYSMERENEHIVKILEFAAIQHVPDFFCLTRQNTCEVYPYWPRAAILEAATFYLSKDRTAFENMDSFRDQIMSASNIAEYERGAELWDWLAELPYALKSIMAAPGFAEYLKWEKLWIAQQNRIHGKELKQIQDCVDKCVKLYQSPVNTVQIVLSPIKCVYSADYHMKGNSFIYSSGMLRVEAVIHEFLHHVIHKRVMLLKERIIQKSCQYPGVDSSYYLSGSDTGKCNAFEEFTVRELTRCVLEDCYPSDLTVYLEGLL